MRTKVYYACVGSAAAMGYFTATRHWGLLVFTVALFVLGMVDEVIYHVTK